MYVLTYIHVYLHTYFDACVQGVTGNNDSSKISETRAWASINVFSCDLLGCRRKDLGQGPSVTEDRFPVTCYGQPVSMNPSQPPFELARRFHNNH